MLIAAESSHLISDDDTITNKLEVLDRLMILFCVRAVCEEEIEMSAAAAILGAS